MKRINIVCITLLMILLGVNTSCADYLDKAPDEDLTLDDVFTRENYCVFMGRYTLQRKYLIPMKIFQNCVNECR